MSDWRILYLIVISTRTGMMPRAGEQRLIAKLCLKKSPRHNNDTILVARSIKKLYSKSVCPLFDLRTDWCFGMLVKLLCPLMRSNEFVLLTDSRNIVTCAEIRFRGLARRRNWTLNQHTWESCRSRSRRRWWRRVGGRSRKRVCHHDPSSIKYLATFLGTAWASECCKDGSWCFSVLCSSPVKKNYATHLADCAALGTVGVPKLMHKHNCHQLFRVNSLKLINRWAVVTFYNRITILAFQTGWQEMCPTSPGDQMPWPEYCCRCFFPGRLSVAGGVGFGPDLGRSRQCYKYS